MSFLPYDDIMRILEPTSAKHDWSASDPGSLCLPLASKKRVSEYYYPPPSSNCHGGLVRSIGREEGVLSVGVQIGLIKRN